jgi:hypothetical protein
VIALALMLVTVFGWLITWLLIKVFRDSYDSISKEGGWNFFLDGISAN